MDDGLKKLLEEYGISSDRFASIIEIIKKQKSNSTGIDFAGFPPDNDSNITGSVEHLSCSWDKTARLLKDIDKKIEINDYAEKEGNSAVFDSSGLILLGLRLLPHTAYGILNGGSASSYADRKKNCAFHPGLFQNLEKVFGRMAGEVRGKPKSQTPAYLNPDSSPGYTYIELKLRNLLLCVKEYCRTFSSFPAKGLPVFQMTSGGNNAEVDKFQKTLSKSPILENLIDFCSFSPLPIKTGVQPQLAALDISALNGIYQPFICSVDGKKAPLPMPGGHGENFNCLKKIYRQMNSENIRIACLTNSDNLGSTLNLKENALMVLWQADAAFEFSVKTPIDVKGGVLIYDKALGLTCADIGAAIPGTLVKKASGEGSPVLFNCANGIFNLEYLNNNIEQIIENLPVRISVQDKDTGRYCQAEQITWEVIGLVPRPIIFKVSKYERFLASKLLVENFLMSGHGINYLKNHEPGSEMTLSAEKLHSSFILKMNREYLMKIINRKWQSRDSEKGNNIFMPD